MDDTGQNPQGPQEMPTETKGHGIERFFHEHPVAAFFAVVFFIALLCMMGTIGSSAAHDPASVARGLIGGTGFLALALIFPFGISVVNLAGVFLGPQHTKTFHLFAAITLIGGAALTYFYITIEVSDIIMKDWQEVLYNTQVHAPVWSEGVSSLALIVGLGVVAYCVLAHRRAYELPPLLIVVCMGALYLWGIVCVIWCVQLSGGEDNPFRVGYLPLLVLPINCIFLILREIRMKLLEWNSAAESRAQKEWTDPWNRLLQRSELWPVLALVAMLPILGILMCILVLFGQAPDVLIRAFTETADWRLSEKVAPPNLHYDEHYLCTVAAGGDRRIVKPLRMGVRHGHRVVVNRQLQIANAFEQVLEERMPRAHRRIRRFYDTHGYPIARHIRTKRACDMVYLLMKPLEWCFLLVLYLTDVRPEDRIAVQYLPKPNLKPHEP